MMANWRQLTERASHFTRVREWWDSKIGLTFAVAYALAWREDIGPSNLWQPLLLLLICGIVCSVFASVFNDLTDEKEDRLAGKTTGIMALSPAVKWMTLILIELSMAGIACLLSLSYRFAQYTFIALWILFTAYCLSPIRLKARGISGVICIALCEHMIPSILATFLILEYSGRPLPALWFTVLIIWSLMVGCRSILWHQLCDRENDALASSGTMGTRYDPERLQWLGERIVFPIEVASFLSLLLLSGPNSLTWVFLTVHMTLEWARTKCFDANIVIVAPKPNMRFALFEYYQCFFPLAYLIPAVPDDLWTLGVISAQLALFSAPPRLSLDHLLHILRNRVFRYLTRR